MSSLCYGQFVSPRASDPDLSRSVLEAAGRLLGRGGSTALTTRALAAEAGTSTMAIYSRFGSLAEVHQAVRVDGFERLGHDLEAAGESGDPVADLAALAVSYYGFALDNAELYRAMFADRPPGGEDAGAGVFAQLAGVVDRCVADGRFVADDAAASTGWAAQVWVALHGMVVLALAGVQPGDRIRALLADMLYRLALGYGDDPQAARRSVALGSAPAP